MGQGLFQNFSTETEFQITTPSYYKRILRHSLYCGSKRRERRDANMHPALRIFFSFVIRQTYIKFYSSYNSPALSKSTSWPNIRRFFALLNKPKLHINKICFILHYSQTRFGRLCDHRQGFIQEYKQYTNVCLFCWRYNPLWLYFHNPAAGFSLLVFDVSRSHTTTRHSR
jgi:hypothetical protein